MATLARRAVTAHAAWIRYLAEAISRPWLETERWSAHDLGVGSLLSNQALLLRPLADADAAEFVEQLNAVCPPFASCILLSPWPTPDLRPFGFYLLGHPPLMVRHPAPSSPCQCGLEVREVLGRRELRDCEQVLLAGLPADLEGHPGCIFPAAVLAMPVRFWVGYASGRPVSTAVTVSAGGVTMVECVVTVPDATGLGYGSALASAATTAVASRSAMVVASEDGRRLYERLGYVPLARWTAWTRATDQPRVWA